MFDADHVHHDLALDWTAIRYGGYDTAGSLNSRRTGDTVPGSPHGCFRSDGRQVSSSTRRALEGVMRITRIVVGVFVGVAIAVSFGWTVSGRAGAADQGAGAQGPPPLRFSVATTQVKPDLLQAYQDLIRTELVPAVKKAGIAWRWVFANTPMGGQGFTFVTVTPITNYAQFDQPNPLQAAMGADALARYNAKIRATIESTSTVIHTSIESASLQSFSRTPPNLVIVTTLNLLPGKGPDFTSLITTEYLPALKKAGVTDYWVSAANFGAPNSMRTIVTTAKAFADIDAGPAINRALGAEAAQKLNQKRAALTTSIENVVLRLVPELSFGVPMPPKS
ncbi:MAG: hypothetical protein ACT4QD_24330 [Acidobacteriota bacterium]